jgi:FkbM family methyltransferase
MKSLISRGSRFIRRTLGNHVLPEPYDYVQSYTEQNLHKYVGKPKEGIQLIVIVGGYLGHEISRLIHQYKKTEVIVFEPSTRYFERLRNRFHDTSNISIHQFAVGSETGDKIFYETSLKGAGSLLRLNEFASKSYGATQEESFMVRSITLDEHARLFKWDSREVDILWIDVQGAESQVIAGATTTLKRTRSVFIEVSRWMPTYQEGALMEDIEKALYAQSFRVELLGLDVRNGTGNALFVSPESFRSRWNCVEK